MPQDKLRYIVETLSRTKRKDYENYVINAIWNRLDNPDNEPPRSKLRGILGQKKLPLHSSGLRSKLRGMYPERFNLLLSNTLAIRKIPKNESIISSTYIFLLLTLAWSATRLATREPLQLMRNAKNLSKVSCKSTK
jgi:hypothetical protein